MTMAELIAVVGAVASVVQLADTAFRLSKTLYSVSSALATASEDIRVLSRDLEVFGQSLTLLSRLLGDGHGGGDGGSRYSDAIYLLTSKIIEDCADIYEKIDRLMAKLRKNSLKNRLKWIYKEKRIAQLVARLGHLKATLMTVLMSLQVDMQLSILTRGRSAVFQTDDVPLHQETLVKLQIAQAKVHKIVSPKDNERRLPSGMDKKEEVDDDSWSTGSSTLHSLERSVSGSTISSDSITMQSNFDAFRANSKTANPYGKSKSIDSDAMSVSSFQSFATALSIQPSENTETVWSNFKKPEIVSAQGEKANLDEAASGTLAWREGMAKTAQNHLGMSAEAAKVWAWSLPLPEKEAKPLAYVPSTNLSDHEEVKETVSTKPERGDSETHGDLFSDILASKTQDSSSNRLDETLQQDLDETALILAKAAESVIQRGERLDFLVENSGSLSSQSKLFSSKAQVQFRRSFWSIPKLFGSTDNPPSKPAAVQEEVSSAPTTQLSDTEDVTWSMGSGNQRDEAVTISPSLEIPSNPNSTRSNKIQQAVAHPASVIVPPGVVVDDATLDQRTFYASRTSLQNPDGYFVNAPVSRVLDPLAFMTPSEKLPISRPDNDEASGMKRHESTSSGNEKPRRPANLAERSKYQFDTDSSDDENMQDNIKNDLDLLGGSMARLNALARSTGKEVEAQNSHIDRIMSKSDVVEGAHIQATYRIQPTYRKLGDILDDRTLGSWDALNTETGLKAQLEPTARGFSRSNYRSSSAAQQSQFVAAAGDLDDPASRFHRSVSPEPTEHRAPSPGDLLDLVQPPGAAADLDHLDQLEHPLLPDTQREESPTILAGELPLLHDLQLVAARSGFQPSLKHLDRLWWRGYAKLEAEKPETLLDLESILGNDGSWPEDPSSDKSWATIAAKTVDNLGNELQLESAMRASNRVEATRVLEVLKVIDSSLGFETASIAWTLASFATIKLLHVSTTAKYMSETGEIIGIVARYAVMENLYRSTTGLVLRSDYEEALVSMSALVLEYLASVAVAFITNPDAIIDSTKQMEKIRKAEQDCRHFAVVTNTQEKKAAERFMEDISEESDDESLGDDDNITPRPAKIASPELNIFSRARLDRIK